MAYIVNTDVNSLNTLSISKGTSNSLNSALEKLSSGLRINKAADDASGLVIADQLRAQAKGLQQASKNANDSIGLIKIADKAIAEQEAILETIKAKSIQAAQDTQTNNSRKAIQKDILRLVEQIDNIANQTSYNGLKLLAGSFTNKEFQVGAYSNETIKASISATSSDKIGSIRKQTSAVITEAGDITLQFRDPSAGNQTVLESATIGSKAGTGIGALAEVINKNSDKLGVRASYSVRLTADKGPIKEGSVRDLTINGINIGDIDNIKANDQGGTLVNAINKYSAETGVRATTTVDGSLVLTSTDGRGIELGATNSSGINGVVAGSAQDVLGITLDMKRPAGSVVGTPAVSGSTKHYGRLTLTQLSSNSIDVSVKAKDASAVTAAETSFQNAISTGSTKATFNLRSVLGVYSVTDGQAAGAYANATEVSKAGSKLGSGVMTKTGANIVNDIADSAISQLNNTRSDLGSVQNQLEATVSNLDSTRVNVKAAESGIRDVNMAEANSEFSKQKILSQTGNYALSQANILQKNVLQLLQ